MYSSVAHMASHPWKAGAAGAVGAVGPGRGLGVLGRCRSSMLLILGKEDRNQGPLSSTIKGNARLVIRQTFALVSWSY